MRWIVSVASLLALLALMMGFQNCSEEVKIVTTPGGPQFFDKPYGFSGANLTNNKLRSDFDDPDAGTESNPLHYPKAFLDEDGNPTECIFKPLKTTEWCASEDNNVTFWPNGDYPLEHPGQQGNAGDSDEFWLVSLNNEVFAEGKSAFHPCNSGPPNLNQPLNDYGEGVMGAKIENESLYLSMDLAKQFEEPLPHMCGPYNAPFLAVGAHAGRGNENPVAYISDPLEAQYRDLPSVLRFKTKIEEWVDPVVCVKPNGKPTTGCSNPGYTAYRLMFMADFPDLVGSRMMQINLHKNRDNGDHDRGQNLQWNWPVAESFYYPGADLSFFGEDKYRLLFSNNNNCSGGIQRTDLEDGVIQFTMDISKLYQCAISRNHYEGISYNYLKAKEIPIQGIHWILEAFGTEGISKVSVSDIELLKYSEL